MSAPPLVNIPVFSGQGTASTNSPQTAQRALRDASSPSGFLLLCACHEAFHNELTSLSPVELEQTGLYSADFQSRNSLLALPPTYCSHNPIISGTRLCLIQSLRYLAFVESLSTSTDSFVSFNEVLESNSEHRIGILGFSSGILPACVVGASVSTLSFITWAIEAYRLAFWIGVRSQMYRATSLRERGLPNHSSLPWSRVFVGLNERAAEEAISVFRNQDNSRDSSLCITAVMDDNCVTVSGFPDTLKAFADTLHTRFTIHDTTVDALYHSSIHATTRRYVLTDVSRRKIRFPDFADLKIPVRSSFTGRIIDNHASSGSLVDLVVDILLIQPVNWNLVVSETVKSCEGDISLHLVNVGPGTGSIRCMEKVFLGRNVSVLDLAVPDPKITQPISPMQEPIAIVGMAVNMPGAQNAHQLWELLEKGINTISEIPEHRFKVSDYDDPKHAKPGRTMKACTGNFIDGVDEFDHSFFRISPREAKSMDPQQRILLQTAYEALENCGYVPNDTPSFQQRTFGCYIGAATHDYLQNLRDEIDVYYSTGTLKAFLSGRISYAMQLGGPSVVVDTACSSSSVAIYQGCRALMNGDCNAALVGGVNVITSPDMFLGLDRGHLLSPTGQCKAFDALADGYSRSEGCGVFVIKRLSDAESENDNILGVIRGIEVNQSGPAHSITHPHFPTQAALFRQLLERARVGPCRVNVVEAHGTGTIVGDPIEIASIRSVFSTGRTANNPLYITSIKGNIGHLEAASGAAGLAKLLLMLDRGIIPRQISLRNLNPAIAPLDADHSIIPTQHITWRPSHDGMTRVALLNSFGAAGSNTALLLEEYIPSRLQISKRTEMPLVFGLSAKTETALEELRLRYLQWLSNPTSQSEPLVDIAYTMTARRQIYPYRLAVSANERSTLIKKLAKAPMVHCSGQPGNVVFVFSGQGSQYPGMGRSLYQTSSLFRRHINDCHSILISLGFPGVLPIIAAGPDREASSPRQQFEAYQSAIVAVEYSLAKLWISWGLNPIAVVGHSLGEYAALVIANVLTLKDSLTLVASRARLMVTRCAPNCTGMMAVNAGPAAVERELKSFTGLTIACFNSPIDCVVAGPLGRLHVFKAHLESEVGCKSTLLPVSFGYHSAAMNPILADLTIVAQGLAFRPPSIPTVSTVLGDVVLPGDDSVFNAEYFTRHCSEPVLFEMGVLSLVATPDYEAIDAWIDIGPHPTSLPMLKSCSVLSEGALLVASLRKQQDPWLTLVSSLSQLHLSNVFIRWREVFIHHSPTCCAKVPSYPFAKTKFWVPFKENDPTAIPASAPTHLIAEYSMLHSWAQYPSSSNGNVAIFETPISDLSDSIQGHRVGGLALCPVSVYLEQIFAGIDLAKRYSALPYDDGQVVLRATEFVNPLVYDERIARTVKTSITLHDGFGVFSVSSLSPSSAEEVIHVNGNLVFQSTSEMESKFSRKRPVIARRISATVKAKDGETPEVFSQRTAYEIIFPRVVDYSKRYRTMQSITVDPSGMEGYATISLPRDHEKGKYVVHPIFMDTLIHAAGFLANLHGGPPDVYICSGISSVKVIPELVDNDATYGVYCSNAWLPDEGVMLAEAYAVQLPDSGKIVAHLKGMHFRRIRFDSLKRRLALAIGDTTFQGSKPSFSEHALPSAHHAVCMSPHSRNDVKMEVLRVMSESCALDFTGFDAHLDLASLGIDSLLSVQIFRKLQDAFPDVDLSPHLFSRCHSPDEIAREVSSRCSLASSRSSQDSSPRTLVADEKLLEPSSLDINEEPDTKRILASVLCLSEQDLDDDVDFHALGLDSLTSIEALHALKSEFELELPRDFFLRYPTIRAVQSYLSGTSPAGRNDKGSASAELSKGRRSDMIARTLRLHPIPVLIQQSRDCSRTPLFLFHDGSGLIDYYDRLHRLDRNIWGIPNPNFINGRPWNCLMSMAVWYAQRVQETTPGPVLLGGWSFGGVVAFEAARYLLLNGIPVKGVLLIDSPVPAKHTQLSDALLDYVVGVDEERNERSEIGKLVKAQFKMNSYILGRHDPLSSEGPFPSLALLRSKEGFNPREVPDVPLWLADRSEPEQVVADWERLVKGPVKIWRIPGHHFRPFDMSNVAEVSRCIAEACQYLETL